MSLLRPHRPSESSPSLSGPGRIAVALSFGPLLAMLAMFFFPMDHFSLQKTLLGLSVVPALLIWMRSTGRLSLRGARDAEELARFEASMGLHPGGLPAGEHGDSLWRPHGQITVSVSAAQRMVEPDLDLLIDLGGALKDISLQPSLPALVGLRLGDPAFDEAVFVRGPSAQLRALLHGPNRTLVRRFVQDLEGSLSDGRIRVRLRRRRRIIGRDRSSRGVDLVVTQALELVDALLARQADVPGCLREVALQDPVAAVAAGAARQLLALGGPEAATLTRELLDDPRPELALIGAQAVGQEGAAVLRALVSKPGVSSAVRAQAVSALTLLKDERATELQGQLSLKQEGGQLALAQAGELSETR